MPAEPFVPAAGRGALTPFYDAAVALTMRERTFRGRLVAQAAADRPARVLELGCGTGSLTALLARDLPHAAITALDPDPDALARAQRKVAADRVTWVEGSALATGLAEGSMDVVVCSLVLHHLTTEQKHSALREARRVLRRGGRLHVADWGRPQDPVMAAAFTALRVLDGFAVTRAHAAGELPKVIAEAGFAAVTTRDRLRTGFGTLELLVADRG